MACQVEVVVLAVPSDGATALKQMGFKLRLVCRHLAVPSDGATALKHLGFELRLVCLQLAVPSDGATALKPAGSRALSDWRSPCSPLRRGNGPETQVGDGLRWQHSTCSPLRRGNGP